MDSYSEFVLAEDDGIMSELSEFIEIPTGGFNRIFKVKRYGQWFILKTLKEKFQNQTIYRQLLKKEFELGVQFNHPNVIRYMTFECNTPYGAGILMEYVDGVTLKEYISTTMVSDKQQKKIANELLAGVSYLHKLQLMHRDLKPANIMIAHNGNNLKIIDFGLSDADYYAILKQPVGSAGYYHPDTFKSNEKISGKHDLFAIGVILQEIFPNKLNIYNRIGRRCCKSEFKNIDEVLNQLEWDSKIKRFAAYTTTFVLVLLVAFGAFTQSNIYSNYTQIKHEKEAKEVWTEKICSVMDSCWNDLELRIDTNTCLYREELFMTMSYTNIDLGERIQSLIQSDSMDNELSIYLNNLYVQRYQERAIIFGKKLESIPSAEELFQKGEITLEEYSAFVKKLRQLSEKGNL